MLFFKRAGAPRQQMQQMAMVGGVGGVGGMGVEMVNQEMPSEDWGGIPVWGAGAWGDFYGCHPPEFPSYKLGYGWIWYIVVPP